MSVLVGRPGGGGTRPFCSILTVTSLTLQDILAWDVSTSNSTNGCVVGLSWRIWLVCIFCASTELRNGCIVRAEVVILCCNVYISINVSFRAHWVLSLARNWAKEPDVHPAESDGPMMLRCRKASLLSSAEPLHRWWASVARGSNLKTRNKKIRSSTDRA